MAEAQAMGGLTGKLMNEPSGHPARYAAELRVYLSVDLRRCNQYNFPCGGKGRLTTVWRSCWSFRTAERTIESQIAELTRCSLELYNRFTVFDFNKRSRYRAVTPKEMGRANAD